MFSALGFTTHSTAGVFDKAAWLLEELPALGRITLSLG